MMEEGILLENINQLISPITSSANTILRVISNKSMLPALKVERVRNEMNNLNSDINQLIAETLLQNISLYDDMPINLSEELRNLNHSLMDALAQLSAETIHSIAILLEPLTGYLDNYKQRLIKWNNDRPLWNRSLVNCILQLLLKSTIDENTLRPTPPPIIDLIKTTEISNNFGRIVGIPDRARWNSIWSTVQTNVVKNPAFLRTILDLLPRETETDDAILNGTDTLGYSVLIDAIHLSPSCTKMLLERLPQDKRLEMLLKSYNAPVTSSFLEYSISYPNSMRAIFEVLPENERIQAIKAKNGLRTIVQQTFLHNKDSLKAILELLPKGQRMPALQQRCPYTNDTLLDKLMDSSNDSEDFKKIVKIYDPTENYISKMTLQGQRKFIKALVSYEKIYSTVKNADPFEQAKALLRDYTKNNSRIVRFFTGHINRHHIVAVNNLLNNSSISTLDTLIEELQKITVNPNGSLARRITYIASPDLSRASIEQAPTAVNATSITRDQPRTASDLENQIVAASRFS